MIPIPVRMSPATAMDIAYGHPHTTALRPPSSVILLGTQDCGHFKVAHSIRRYPVPSCASYPQSPSGFGTIRGGADGGPTGSGNTRRASSTVPGLSTDDRSTGAKKANTGSGSGSAGYARG